ncbi:hypothetical protein A2V94_07080 [Candidatus Atribacteria bacterium RBG_16_35_8]|nr:MAG: hypothetical protein A2V94_07080 [Candidatus Atribacteria bacterium RBG_16_35_8]
MRIANPLTIPKADFRYLKSNISQLYLQEVLGHDEFVYIRRDDFGNLIFKDNNTGLEYTLSSLISGGKFNTFLTNFTYNDIGSSIIIGSCVAGNVISKVVFEVIEPFNGGLTITIGDAIGQGRLMTANQNNPSYSGSYCASPNYLYETSTEIRIYFPSGLSTSGVGRVIVYLQ